MEKTAKKKRPAIGWALGFCYLSTLLLVVLATLLVLATTVCSEKYMTAQVGKSAFSDAAYSLLRSNYESYAAATGFDSAVLTNQISAAQVQADMEDSVVKIYAGDTAFDARNQIAEATYAAMQADLESRGVEITETVQSGIEIVADACRSDYAGYVSVPLASQLYTAISKLKSVILVGLIFAAIFSAASLYLTVHLAPNVSTGMRCLVFVFISAAVLCLLAAFALYPALHISELTLEPTSIRLLLLGYIRNLFDRYSLFGAIYGILAAALLALNAMARSKARQRIRNTKYK